VKGIIFDFDGVLVNSMPVHYEAWKTAFLEICSLQVNERTVYLLEGMRGVDLVREIFRIFNYNELAKVESVTKRKDQIFRSMIDRVNSYPCTEELVKGLTCIKGIASGSAKHDVESILKRSFQQGLFQIVLTADNIEQGKPDPQAFQIFLQKSNIDSKDVIVVENSPLGVKAALRAGLRAIVVLNNSPLIRDDFVDLVSPYDIFAETKNTRSLLYEWCMNSEVSH
jgi:beta-phosphoglucomutase-like phosphatase (HAD superfamily)